MKLPVEFDKKIKLILGNEYDSYIECYNQPRWYGLRVNTKKISCDEFERICPFEIKQIPWIENGYYYDGDSVSPAKHPYYFAGLYYLQEPSAMTPANRLPIEPGDRVLDLCAAPGGKATELGAKLEGEGVLVANDISNSRAKGLLKNIEMFGIDNALVLSEEPGKLVEYFPEYFNKILIDAPCSGEGMFRKDKKMMSAWEVNGPEYFSKIQRDILMKASQMLAPGGLLLYSTCTFDNRENEKVIEYLISNMPEFEICDIFPYEGFENGRPDLTEEKMKEISKTVRIWPHKMKGEGHYLALLKKRGLLLENKGYDAKKKFNGAKELKDFFSNIKWNLDDRRIYMKEERIYYLPENIPNIKKLRFLRTGLFLGELKKNRFEPSQALAMSLTIGDYKHTISLPATDERILRYLKGETIDISDVSETVKGWTLVCVDQYPLGWGKNMNGMLKNKYSPGWRWV